MGIASKGINAQIIGKVGNAVGYMLNGQHVVRSLPTFVKRKSSESALLNQERMKVTSLFLKPIKHVIDFGYQAVAPKGSRIGTFQAAQSHVFKNALAYQEDGRPFVSAEKVLVFRGPLTPPQHLTVERVGNSLHFTWSETNESMFLMMAYNEKLPLVIFNAQGPSSDLGTFSWDLGSDEPVHVYGGFYQIVSGELSDSVYAGEV